MALRSEPGGGREAHPWLASPRMVQKPGHVESALPCLLLPFQVKKRGHSLKSVFVFNFIKTLGILCLNAKDKFPVFSGDLFGTYSKLTFCLKWTLF